MNAPATDPVSAEDDERFGRYNFHPEARVAALVGLLRGNEPGKVAMLSGAPGAGGGYLLDAAIHRLRAAGEPWDVVDLDLDGSEPDAVSLQTFVEHVLAKRPRDERVELGRAIRPLAEIVDKTALAPELLSTLLGLVKPLRELVALIETVPTTPLPGLPGRERLSSLLDTMSARTPLALLVRRPAQLTDPMRRLLLQACERSPSLALVIRALPEDRTELIVPLAGQAATRIELAALDRAEVRAVIDHRFSPNTFPDALADALWRVTAGSPRELAARFGELDRDHGIAPDDHGVWRLADGGLEAESVVRVFSFRFYDPIDRWLRNLPTAERTTMCAFLASAIICGDNVPTDVVLASLGLDREQADAVIDLVDDRLVADDDGPGGEDPDRPTLFRDLGYRHPGFPGMKVYAFTNTLVRLALRDRLPFRRWTERARELVMFIDRVLPASTRAQAEVLLNATTFLDDGPAREQQLQRLAWWIGRADAEALTESLVDQLARRELAPELLWVAIVRSDLSWPPYRQWALLEAYRQQPDGVPMDALPRYQLVNAKVLNDLGRYRVALVAAVDAARRYHSIGDKARVSESLSAAVVILGRLFKYEVAERAGRRSLELAEEVYGPVDASVATSAGDLAIVLGHRGKYGEARALHERALSIWERLGKRTHPHAGMSRVSLGELLANAGEFAAARALFEEAREIYLSAYGLQTGLIAVAERGLALALLGLGLPTEAQAAIERAFSIEDAVFGPKHPGHADSLYVAAEIALAHGDLETAARALERALEINVGCYAPTNPRVREVRERLDEVRAARDRG